MSSELYTSANFRLCSTTACMALAIEHTVPGFYVFHIYCPDMIGKLMRIHGDE